jgi:NADPH:quinone reductase-like Zn-dependent oxidoreductase
VLVHAAAGGVGTAAVQVARWLGAEVYGTASPSKWDLLRAAGVTTWRRRATSGSPSAVEGRGHHRGPQRAGGEFVDASLGCCPPGGRFVEMGKTDVRDAAEVGAHGRVVPRVRPRRGRARIRAMFGELLAGFASGRAAPRAHAGAPLCDVPGRCSGRWPAARHVGKLVFATGAGHVRPDGVVLVSGGTGALGPGGGRLARRAAPGRWRCCRGAAKQASTTTPASGSPSCALAACAWTCRRWT